MSDDECERRPCVACGRVVPERDEQPYADHAEACALAGEWRALDMTVPVIPVDPDIDARVEAMAREATDRMRRRE